MFCVRVAHKNNLKWDLWSGGAYCYQTLLSKPLAPKTHGEIKSGIRTGPGHLRDTARLTADIGDGMRYLRLGSGWSGLLHYTSVESNVVLGTIRAQNYTPILTPFIVQTSSNSKRTCGFSLGCSQTCLCCHPPVEVLYAQVTQSVFVASNKQYIVIDMS